MLACNPGLLGFRERYNKEDREQDQKEDKIVPGESWNHEARTF